MFLPFSTNIIRICVWSSKYISPTSECEAKGWEFHARDPTRKQTSICFFLRWECWVLMLYHLLAFAPVSGWVSEWQFQVWHYRISELRPTRLQSKKRDNFTAVSQLRMWDKRMRVSRKWVLEGADWQMFTDSDIFLFTLVFNWQSLLWTKMFYIKCIKWAHFKSSPLPAFYSKRSK